MEALASGPSHHPSRASLSFTDWLTALVAQGYEQVDYDKLPDPNRAEDCPEEADEQSRLDDKGGSERAVFTITIGALEVKVISGAKATGTGWRVWPASRLLAECILANSALLARSGRTIELGAGCGLVGCTAGKISPQEIVISDYKDAIVSRLTRAIELNGLVSVVDWTSIPASYAHSFTLILGSDLIYSLEAGDTLAAALPTLSAPGGVFLGCFSHYRVGFAEFAANIRRASLTCAFLHPPRASLAALRCRYSHWIFVLAEPRLEPSHAPP